MVECIQDRNPDIRKRGRSNQRLLKGKEEVWMKMRFWSVVFAIAIGLGAGWSPAAADEGDYGLPFWAFQVGNQWNRSFSGDWGNYSLTQEISQRDTASFPVPTFVMDSWGGGTLWDQRWFSVSLGELKLWKVREYDDVDGWETLIFDAPPVWAKNPLIVGDSWVNNTTGTLTNQGVSYPFSASMTVTVQARESVTVPQGTYMAFRINHLISLNGEDPFSETYWVVPYIGVLKSVQVETEGTDTGVLTSMSVKKWIVDYESTGDTTLSAYHLPSNQFFSEEFGNLGQYGWGQSASMPLAWDFDGDGITDVSIYHIPTNQWFVRGYPNDNMGQFGWGGAECIPVPGDYNGDGVMERAFYHWPSNRWFVEGQAPVTFGYGGAASIPIAMDYDGDGKTDMMIYHVESNQWFVHGIGELGQFGWGGANCIPVPGDWNGDGKIEIGVYYVPDNEWIWRDASGTAHFMGQFGWGGAQSFPITADFEGQGAHLRLFYRPAENWWFADGFGDMVWGWGGADFMPVMNPLATYNWFRFRLGMFQ
jgi:hypothetical protein